jgi:hypothetical protein
MRHDNERNTAILTSSLPLFVPLVPSFLAPAPAFDELPSLFPPPDLCFDEDDAEALAALACACNAFCTATFSSFNFSSREAGAHSSHLHFDYEKCQRFTRHGLAGVHTSVSSPCSGHSNEVRWSPVLLWPHPNSQP